MTRRQPGGKYEKQTDRGPGWWQTSRVRGYGQYCPVAKVAEVLGERWTLLVVRELVMGAHRFTDIQRGMPGISRSVLTQRLRRLEEDGLLERRDAGGGREEYWLTRLGLDLEPALMALGEWAVRNYGHDPTAAEADPTFFMLYVERLAVRAALPEGRFVARFEFPGARPPRAWLVVEERVPIACKDDPGLPADLVVTGDARTFHRVQTGRLGLSAALRSGDILLDGSAEHRRAFSHWFGYTPFAPAARAALAAGASARAV